MKKSFRRSLAAHRAVLDAVKGKPALYREAFLFSRIKKGVEYINQHAVDDEWLLEIGPYMTEDQTEQRGGKVSRIAIPERCLSYARENIEVANREQIPLATLIDLILVAGILLQGAPAPVKGRESRTRAVTAAATNSQQTTAEGVTPNSQKECIEENPAASAQQPSSPLMTAIESPQDSAAPAQPEPPIPSLARLAMLANEMD